MNYYFFFIPLHEGSHLANLRLFSMLFFSHLYCPKPHLYIFFIDTINGSIGVSIYLEFSSKYIYKHKLITILDYRGYPLLKVFSSKEDFYQHLTTSNSFFKSVFLHDSKTIFSNQSFNSLNTILKKYSIS
jgi:hypothetical protein